MRAPFAPPRLSEPRKVDADAQAILKANGAATIQGKLRFNGVGNYGDDLMRVKQVQNGHWTVVWPKEFTAGGAKLLSN